MSFADLYTNVDKSRELASFIGSDLVQSLTVKKLLQMKKDVIRPFKFWKGWQKQLFKEFKDTRVV
jgi:hypothetical protein